MHEKGDKLSLIKLNFIHKTSFLGANTLDKLSLINNSNVRDKLSQIKSTLIK